MPSSTYTLVREAITTKRIVVATYGGHVRELCPHAIGMKNGKEHALFYQVGGTSSTRPIGPPGSKQNWRCLDLSKLQNVGVKDGEWGTAPNHSRPQSCVDEIDVEVEY